MLRLCKIAVMIFAFFALVGWIGVGVGTNTGLTTSGKKAGSGGGASAVWTFEDANGWSFEDDNGWTWEDTTT